MEEQFMFTRVHDALDVPTPPGAYERLRTELMKKPVRRFRWPALQMRNSNMGFRLAAGLVAVAIVIAAAVAALAIHNSTNNVSPAGSRMSIQAYENMIFADNAAAAATYSSPCDIGIHSGCGDDARRGIPAVEKWVNDISRQDIPTRYAIVNADMRQRLLQNLVAQQDLLAASQSGDGAAMDRAFYVAVFAVYWTSGIIQAIHESHQADAATYVRFVASERTALDSCGAGCGFAGGASPVCSKTGGLTCQELFDNELGPIFDGFEADLVREVAPASLADGQARLQSDLAQAGAALMTLRVAVADDDETGVEQQVKLLRAIRVQIDADAAKITG
jgi:hypothetical protein